MMTVTKFGPLAKKLGSRPSLARTRLSCRARSWSKPKEKETNVVVQQDAPVELDQEEEVDEYSAPPAYPVYLAPPAVAASQYATQQAIPAAPPPPVAQPASSGPPFYVWVLVGAALGWVFGKIQEFRKNPMAFMAKLMSSQAGAASGAGPGGMDMAALMQQMQAAQGMPGAAEPAGFSALTPAPPQPVSTAGSSARNGAAFEQKRRGNTSENERVTSVLDVSSSDVTDSPTAAPSSTGGAVPSNSFFSDSDRSAANASSSSAGQATASYFSDKQGASTAGGSAPNAGNANNPMHEDLFDRLLEMIENNPEMRAQMESHLPEGMRGTDIWSWVRNNPAMKQQLMSQMGPLMSRGFGGMDPDMGSKAFQQAKEAGLDPNLLMAEIAKDPELMNLMQKPNVSAALLQMQSDPEKAWEHMSDPDVTKMMMKLTELQAKHGFVPGGMPGQRAVPTQGAAGVSGGMPGQGHQPQPGTPNESQKSAADASAVGAHEAGQAKQGDKSSGTT